MDEYSKLRQYDKDLMKAAAQERIEGYRKLRPEEVKRVKKIEKRLRRTARKERAAAVSYVYIAHSAGWHKVGKANSPEARIINLQTASPHLVELVAKYEFETGDMAEQAEAAVHQVLRRYRGRGEWFSCDFEMIQGAVTKVKAGQETASKD